MSGVDYGVDYSDFEFNPPPAAIYYPDKEIPALLEQVKGGLMPLSELLSKLGRDFDETMARYGSDKDVILGLELEFGIFNQSKDSKSNNKQV